MIFRQQIGAKIFDEDDPPAENRPLDDPRFSLDYFCTKILTLPEKMNTAPGRAFANERVHFTKQFLDVMLNAFRPEIMRG